MVSLPLVASLLIYQQNNPAGHSSHAMSQSSSQGDVNQRSGYHMGQQYSSGHGDQRSFQSGQNPNYDDQRNRQGGSEIKYPPRLDPSMSYGSQDYPSNDLRDPSSQFNSHPPSQYSGAGGAYPSASNDQYPQSYQQHQQQSYQRQQHEQQPGGGNQGYGRPGNFGGADQHPQQPGGGNQRHGGGLVIMEQLVTMEWLVTTVELVLALLLIILHKVLALPAANYPPQGAGSQHLPGQKPPISSHADPNATHPHNDDMPRALRAKVLCRYPGCSFYAIPEFEN